MGFKVPYNYLPLQFKDKNTIFDQISPVLDSAEFTLGPFVEDFERKFANYIGSKYCISTNNGTDALILALNALGIKSGDEVITPTSSFFATAGAIVAVGATPVFADVDSRYQISIAEIENLITPKTRAILPVHWAGASPDMKKIQQIAKQHQLFVVEDACMAIGGKIGNKSPGTFSHIGAFSMHPLKSLNVAGDGGMIATDDESLYEWMKKFRNHGMTDRNHIEFWGRNYRLQPIQAVIASHFIDEVDHYVETRNANGKLLDSLLMDLNPLVLIPTRPSNFLETFSLYMVLAENRNELMEYLIQNGVEVKVHYPIPLHLQQASISLGFNKRDLPVAESQATRILTIPVHQYLNESHMHYISELIHKFYDGASR